MCKNNLRIALKLFCYSPKNIYGAIFQPAGLEPSKIICAPLCTCGLRRVESGTKKETSLKLMLTCRLCSNEQP